MLAEGRQIWKISVRCPICNAENIAPTNFFAVEEGKLKMLSQRANM